MAPARQAPTLDSAPLGTLKSRIRSGLKTLRSLLEHRMEAR